MVGNPIGAGHDDVGSPVGTYTLKWAAGGFKARDIVWKDDPFSPAPEAVALRAWFAKLQQVIEATPEWKALPPIPPGGLYR